MDVRVEAVGRTAQVVVRDDGPGIAADVRPRVLERFTSARGAEQSGSRRHYGIGLALVADVAAAHGGTVAAGNRTDGVSGAELTLTLPLRGR